MIYNPSFDYVFDEKACEKCGGKCCTGGSGNVFANKEEIANLAQFFKLSEEEFMLRYMRKVGFKMSFKELPYEDGMACVFFDQKKRRCSIYPLRPMQCRSFPFWEYFKNRKEELEKECIGIYYLS